MLFERIESEGLARYASSLESGPVLGSLPVPPPIKPRRCADQALEGTAPEIRSMEEPAGEGEIVDAHHLHVTQLPHGLAAGYLQREGWDAVKVVLGGTKGWNSTACPLEL